MNKINTNKYEGGNNMALLAKPSNAMILIGKTESQKFSKENTDNVIKPEFLKQCQRYYKMLHTKGSKKNND